MDFSGSTIWSMRSEYHNTATFCGVGQQARRQCEAKDVVYDEATGGLSMDLSAAYPEEAGLAAYRRHAVLADGAVTITDTFTLNRDGDVMFSLICDALPEQAEGNTFVLHGRAVTFDPTLTLAVEPIPCDIPETRGLPASWNVDTLYRITLRAPVASQEERTFVLTVR